MLRMETRVVLKYCSLLDEFIRVRVFGEGEIPKLLGSARLTNRSTYIQLILNACIVRYAERIQPRMQMLQEEHLGVESEADVYQLCVEVNPGLEIGRVAIPVEDEGSVLHLFEVGAEMGVEDRIRAVVDLEDRIRGRLVGQGDAVGVVARAVRRAAAGLRDPRRPIGSFLFVGQTGVGKTELAKVLAEVLFGERRKLIRVDCSEYAMAHEYSKLIGAPPGYVGHNEGGFLTEEMKRAGRAVVLFDEVEKADGKVHDVLLQLLDEGRLTDSKGESVDFCKALIILTSNAGSREVDAYRRRMGFDRRERELLGTDVLRDRTLEALQDRFRPEFLNRMDDVVVFQALTIDDCVQIVRWAVEEVREFGMGSGMEIEVSGGAMRLVAEKGFSPEYGAREVRRTVHRLITAPISEQIVAGRFARGSRIQVRRRGDRLSFHVA